MKLRGLRERTVVCAGRGAVRTACHWHFTQVDLAASRGACETRAGATRVGFSILVEDSYSDNYSSVGPRRFLKMLLDLPPLRFRASGR